MSSSDGLQPCGGSLSALSQNMTAAHQLPRGDTFGVVIHAHCPQQTWDDCMARICFFRKMLKQSTPVDGAPYLLCMMRDEHDVAGSQPDTPTTEDEQLLHSGGLCDKAAVQQAVGAAQQTSHSKVESSKTILLPAGDTQHRKCVLIPASGQLVMEMACLCGSLDLVRDLLALTGDRAIDVHAEDERNFRDACWGGHLGVVRELLALTGDRAVDVHAAVDECGFHYACWNGHLEVVRELLALEGERAIDVNAFAELAFRTACSQGHLDVVRELLALTGDRAVDVHAENESAFCSACTGGHVAVVRELLSLDGDRRVDVHTDDETAFSYACSEGHADVVRELLALTGDRRVDVHADGSGAFRFACYEGHAAVVHELLALTGDRAMDANADDEEAFRNACARGHVGVVRELLALTGDRAVDVHADDDGGFCLACQNGHVGVVRELLALTGDHQIDFRWDDSDMPGLTYLLTPMEGWPKYAECEQLLRAAPCAFAPTMPLSAVQARSFDDMAVTVANAVQPALNQCTPSRHPALAQQVVQQVLLHALRCARSAMDGGADGLHDLLANFLQEYGVLLAALPAAECALLWRDMQQHGNDVEFSGGIAPHLLAQLRDAVWYGVAVPYITVRRQVDEPGLRGALVRPGRGRAVLYRAAVRAAHAMQGTARM